MTSVKLTTKKMSAKFVTIGCLLAIFSTNASPVDVVKDEAQFKSGVEVALQPRVPLLDGRIVGGDEVLITSFPWQLSLQRYKHHTCGAAIISKKFAVTTAHCIYAGVASAFTLRAGSSKHDTGGVLHPVTKGYIHQSYSTSAMDYDIAILKVSPYFSLGSTHIQSVQLAEVGFIPDEGSELVVSGWGVLDSTEVTIPTHLRAVTVPAVSRSKCKEAYGSELITNRMLCAGYTTGGKDACQGDSGGPLVQGSTLVGIVSWGEGCAMANKPGVYADIGSLRTWITYITGI